MIHWYWPARKYYHYDVLLWGFSMGIAKMPFWKREGTKNKNHPSSALTSNSLYFPESEQASQCCLISIEWKCYLCIFFTDLVFHRVIIRREFQLIIILWPHLEASPAVQGAYLPPKIRPPACTHDCRCLQENSDFMCRVCKFTIIR